MNLVVMGLQWGDEGKGKAIDYLAGDYDSVVRYQGGHNAGHTIYSNGKKVVLHLLPSGILTPGSVSVIAKGTVINPLSLIEEIKEVEALGLSCDNLVISGDAPVILPFHQQLDEISEASRYVKIGTTKRGIGQCYEDLTARRAVFMRDLVSDSFEDKLKPLSEYYNNLARVWGSKPVDETSYIKEYIEAGKFLKKYVKDTTWLLNRLNNDGKNILIEGAQGVLLDVNHGTYPFVTSSNPTVGGIFTGTGLSHKAVDKVTGICKAYTTRVGEGPFPSELKGDLEEELRAKGNEYGATTGRPRRVGWLDLVALKYAVMVNGVDTLFLTKLDVLTGFDKIYAVTEYEADGVETNEFQVSPEFLTSVKPVVKEFRGWNEDIGGVRKREDLPEAAIEYIDFIEKYAGVTVEYISLGVNRDQTINC